MGKHKNKKVDAKKNITKIEKPDSDILWSMSHAPTLNKGYYWLQHLPIIFFTAFIIMITFLKTYHAPMEGYYWHSGGTIFTDFFSYYKSMAIIISGALVLLLILYRLTTQSFFLKKTWIYIPMIIYVIFVVFSWIFSKYPFYAFHGYLDRFEGSLVLISYMVLLFYVINTINSERNIKWVIYAIGVSSSILSILGLSQFLKRDFFQTELGKRLITPNTYIDQLDSIEFTFVSGEIYQTVYNINYVSFYLTLLVPVFGLLFIWEKNIKRKAIYGVISALLIINLIGSKSSGGILGIGVAFIIALVVLNKRILKWWKSVALILVAVILVFALTFNRIFPEISGAIKSVFTSDTEIIHKQLIDYFDTDYDKLTVSCNNEPLTIFVDLEKGIQSFEIKDKEGNIVPLIEDEPSVYKLKDARFDMYKITFVFDSGHYFIVIGIEDTEWPFEVTNKGIFFFNGLGYQVDMDPIPSIGFENKLDFGNGRGLIWSRSLPLIKNHIFLGSGADTYVFEFPQNDYAGKYNAGWPIYNIVDKPHNMYIGVAVNTGLISLIALLVLFGAYIIWSIKIYWRNQFEDFISITGVGIFIGICGFLTAALVNDSSVSVMPLFYGLLGTGIA
ncbi:MAG: O-antigen ligase family protein, partial [Clostridiales bacterium]|nr:O-antigen ligase family protein [Clostridiales bacterium]